MTLCKTDNTVTKMKHLRTILIAALLLGCLAPWQAQAAARKEKKNEPWKGYRFTLVIYGGTDTVMYLGNYYMGSTLAFDTAHLNKKGYFVFENKERVLKPGLYFFVNPAGTYVEFAVYNEKLEFQFETEDPGWQTHMRVRGSKENDYLFTYHQANRATYRVIDSAQRDMTDSAAFAQFRRQQLYKLDSIKEAIIEQHPTSLVALLMNATREPEVPKQDSTGQPLSRRQQWEYYMEHYFDHTRLEDDALVRTPEMIFHQRLVNYLDKALQNAPPETIIQYVDPLIDRAKPAKENFRYLVHTIAEKYLQSNVMSYDAVYVHLVKRYIETGMCDWMSPSVVDDNVKRANTWDKLLLGKPAPPLVMKDAQGQVHSLYALPNKYTLLIFWSPTCGHCKTVIPDLYKRYSKYKDLYDIGTFAVLSEPDEPTRPKWHEFIEKHGLDWLNLDGGEANIDWHEVYDVITTPQIYLLDRDKKILAKKLSAETFEQIINMFEKDNAPSAEGN